jgi:hypothetical protein
MPPAFHLPMPHCHCLEQPSKGTLVKPARDMCATVENVEPSMSSASKGKDHARRGGDTCKQ